MLNRADLPYFVVLTKLCELTGYSRSLFYQKMKSGEFPKTSVSAKGIGWKLEDMPDAMLAHKTDKFTYCDCGSLMHNQGNGRGDTRYFVCPACKARKTIKGAETLPRTKVYFPACECGGKVLKRSSVKGRRFRYGRCVDCATTYRMCNESGVMEKSRPYGVLAEEKPKKEPKPRKVREPKPPKPPKPKAEKMAKTIGQSVKEKAKDIAERHARELVKGVVIPVDKAAAQKRKAIADARDRLEQKRIDKSLFDY